MNETQTSERKEIWHKDFNLKQKDNLLELPSDSAVFAIFGIIDEQPVNCRFVGETTNLQDCIRKIFENPEEEGMKKFMQGPWIQILQYEVLSGSSANERAKIVEKWTEIYKPNIDSDGEYPEYYNY